MVAEISHSGQRLQASRRGAGRASALGGFVYCFAVAVGVFGSHVGTSQCLATSGPGKAGVGQEPARENDPGYRIHRTGPRDLSVRLGEAPVFILKNGYLARFRCTVDDDHWLGTRRHPVSLGWSPDRFPGVEVAEVTAEARADGFTITTCGSKPALPGVRFRTTVEGRVRQAGGPLQYTLRSVLTLDTPEAFHDRLTRKKVEYLDIWFEGLFWPECDGHDRELYETLLFQTPGGPLRSAPKLHVFPSLRGATYETLVCKMPEGGLFGLVDHEEPGYVIRINKLSAPGVVGICWWTWDPHLFMDVPADANRMAYEIEIEQIPCSRGKALAARAVPIAFRKDPDYQLPVFVRDDVNTFRKLVDRSDEWTWERHSRHCFVDEHVGADDEQSVAIRRASAGRTAWYTRALGEDYFDHRRLHGGHRITSVVRTRGVTGKARLGVLCYNGPETRLYEEPDPVAVFSSAVTGTNDWTRLEVAFDATGYKRFKIVLEQDGAGQSWFDNVRLYPDTSASRTPPIDAVLDLRGDLKPPGSRRLTLGHFATSHPPMLNDVERLTLAWANCNARSRPFRLSAGRYRFMLRARGDGCHEDPPLLLVEVNDLVSRRIAVVPGRTREYAVPFGLESAGVVRLSLTFVNDGTCLQQGDQIDKNVFVESITLDSCGPQVTTDN